jgi:hypothetical protein
MAAGTLSPMTGEEPHYDNLVYLNDRARRHAFQQEVAAIKQRAVDDEVQRHIGNIGWAVVGATVLAWDVAAPETLSAAFGRGLDNPRTRPLVIGGLAITGAHLMRVIPERYDPFHYVTHFLGDKLHGKG